MNLKIPMEKTDAKKIAIVQGIGLVHQTIGVKVLVGVIRRLKKRLKIRNLIKKLQDQETEKLCIMKLKLRSASLRIIEIAIGMIMKVAAGLLCTVNVSFITFPRSEKLKDLPKSIYGVNTTHPILITVCT
jgi:hypothetical protein